MEPEPIDLPGLWVTSVKTSGPEGKCTAGDWRWLSGGPWRGWHGGWAPRVPGYPLSTCGTGLHSLGGWQAASGHSSFPTAQKVTSLPLGTAGLGDLRQGGWQLPPHTPLFSAQPSHLHMAALPLPANKTKGCSLCHRFFLSRAPLSDKEEKVRPGGVGRDTAGWGTEGGPSPSLQILLCAVASAIYPGSVNSRPARPHPGWCPRPAQVALPCRAPQAPATPGPRACHVRPASASARATGQEAALRRSRALASSGALPGRVAAAGVGALLRGQRGMDGRGSAPGPLSRAPVPCPGGWWPGWDSPSPLF